MKPVAIFRHISIEGPGYFADFLDEFNIPWKLIRIDAGDTVPGDVREFSGLVFMGGPMSVNDDLPWIPPVLELICKAVALDIPVLGHCLGGQLISKALGSKVTRNPVKEIGWGQVTVANHEVARVWFGNTHTFDAFHWHGETFGLPAGAIHLLSSEYCPHQAYALGIHLALQCHVEMDEEMISEWCNLGAEELAANVSSQAVQSAATIQAQMTDNLPKLNSVARQLYQHWIAGLATN